MDLRKNKALTLVESLVSILLLGAFLCSFLGAFFVSRLSTLRAQHRVVAMNIIREFMEREMEAGYAGDQTGDGDYYATLYSSDPLTQTPTQSFTIDGKLYTIAPDPYFPYNAYEDYSSGKLLTYQNRNYRIVGFTVVWTEDVLGSGTGPTLSERATAYLFDHPA